jgi:spermidine synthase
MEKQSRNARNAVLIPKDEHGTGNSLSYPFQSLFLFAVAFFSGASVMVIELAGIRILAPWFGNSLYTWTALIGVILVSMSCGYYIGGLVADRRPTYVLLAHLIAVAGVSTLAIPFVYPSLESKIGMEHFISGPIAASLLLFAFPGCMLAAVSPFAVKLMSLLTHDRKVGISAGYIGMFSAVGSVVGTFGAGFWLIPHLQLRTLFVIVGAILSLFAIVGYGLFAAPHKRKAQLLTGSSLFFGGILVAFPLLESPVASDTLFEQATYYHRIRVSEKRTTTGDSRRLLHLDSTTEGGQYLRARELPIDYQRYWELTKVLCPHLESALFLGGGGFAMPEAVHDAFPQSRIEVIELDPMVIEVGRRFFRTGEYPRMQVIAGDARLYLRTTDQRYDFIFGDAFNGVHNIPAHLATVEFFDAVKRHLTSHGIYMMNIISAVEGHQSILFHAVTNTMAQVFRHIEVFTLDPGRRVPLQILLILASKEELPVSSLATTTSLSRATKERFLRSYLRPDQYAVSKQVVLTDEYNPVEYIAASVRSKQSEAHGE